MRSDFIVIAGIGSQDAAQMLLEARIVGQFVGQATPTPTSTIATY
jgi:hypothetical protein